MGDQKIGRITFGPQVPATGSGARYARITRVVATPPAPIDGDPLSAARDRVVEAAKVLDERCSESLMRAIITDDRDKEMILAWFSEHRAAVHALLALEAGEPKEGA